MQIYRKNIKEQCYYAFVLYTFLEEKSILRACDYIYVYGLTYNPYHLCIASKSDKLKSHFLFTLLGYFRNNSACCGNNAINTKGLQ